MKFWDTSALIPLLLREERTDAMGALLQADPELVIWWGSTVECASALARSTREGRLSQQQTNISLGLFGALREMGFEILPGEEVRTRAARLLFLHALRAADALQLAAALTWCRERPESSGFVCLDIRLREAAEREGFEIFPKNITAS